MGRDNENRAKRLEAEEKAQVDTRNQLVTLQKELEYVREKLT